MKKITNANSLEAWLKGKPLVFACVLAIRASLRVAPLLSKALYEDEMERRATIVLPSFRALAISSFAAGWPARAAEIRDVAHIAARKVGDTIAETFNNVQINLVEYKEISGDLPFGVVEDFEENARSLNVAGRAVDAVVHAVQAAIDAVDVASGIASPDAVFEAAVSAAVAAHDVVDGAHGYTELEFVLEGNADDEVEVAAHITGLWEAMELDAEILEAGRGEKADPVDLVADLSERALWLGGIPVWASRQWADFKDRLPDDEGWQVWVDWYEARLTGRESIETLEFKRVMIAEEDWEKGPAHANDIIKRLSETKADPLTMAITHSFEEIDSVKEDIDLKEYVDRVRNALPHDPSHAIGTTKELLEATMKTILHRRGHEKIGNINFSTLATRCLSELGLRETSQPGNGVEGHLRKIASSAQQMIETANKLRNDAGTGHGRVVGNVPAVTTTDASLVASTGLVLAAWLLHHFEEGSESR